MALIRERAKNAWNAFMGRDPTFIQPSIYSGSSFRPDRSRPYIGNSKSITSTIYNRIAVDCAQTNIKHIRLNDEGNFEETIDDSLNRALTIKANRDQTGREMIQDAVESMLDEGCVALVPVLTDIDPNNTESYKVEKIRTGKILKWWPREVDLSVYNEDIGKRQVIRMDKRMIVIVQNPFYTIMNEPNSIAQRYKRILSQLDKTNEQNSISKLDLIIQLPYQIKSPAKKQYVNARRKEIEAQLTGSQLGIAYTDGTEKVIQLNRSLENNLWEQEKDLREQLYNQLGLTKSIFDGSADEKTMLNYNNRTIEPILTALTEGIASTWLSDTALSQGQWIGFFRDPFKLTPVAQVAEMADKLTRNEIMSSNEIRAKLGLIPSKNPKADELRNSNINHPDETKESYDQNSKSLDNSKN